MLVIAEIPLDNPFILAPLAGYTDLPFRLLCREYGAALTFSEMISCHGLVYGQKKTLKMLQTVKDERPVGFQLFGNDPDIMAEAATRLCEYPIDLIDINMGCPVRKVTKKGSGAALMGNIQLAEKIIKKVSRASSKPVTVKCRSGVKSESINGVEFAKMAENAGAAALTIHARTWAQAFGGQADPRIIAAVKKAVTIPVIGNGDIQTYEDGERMLLETGCDAVMVGRGALGNPWVFQPGGRPQTLASRMAAVRRHLELAEQFLDTEKNIYRLKNHAGRYVSGLPGASNWRQKLICCTTFSELRELVITTQRL